MAKPAVAIELIAAERRELEALERPRKTALGCAPVGAIPLAAADGLENKAIIAALGVGNWRRRFAEQRLDGFYDEPHPGVPRQIGDAEIAETNRLTLETPLHVMY